MVPASLLAGNLSNHQTTQTSQTFMKTHYGKFGGQYVAETLMGPINELAAAYEEAKNDPAFQAEFEEILRDYVGRESPLTYARRLSEHLGGAKIVLKREDLNHTGAHKVNNTIGQALLARRMGKKRLIAETGAGMHGVATATVAARPCHGRRRRATRRSSGCASLP